MPIAFLAPLLLAAGTADVAKLDCPAIYAKTDYTDDTDLCLTAPMTKPAFEEGMTCIGKFDGSRAMADRITQFVAEAKRADWAKQISANDNLAKQLTDLVARSKDDPDLDHAAGQAAYDAARAPFDGASTLGGPEQLKMWQAEPQISKRCLDVVNFVDANLATRADERDKKSRDN
ncbi:MAG: hypothetical protein J7496_11385 [Novosphingobium sp.]|nr:hypothetical protein [Novosphingobium sp.]MBO9603095.1 hypothetical protein [Novosphingobium sp.]